MYTVYNRDVNRAGPNAGRAGPGRARAEFKKSGLARPGGGRAGPNIAGPGRTISEFDRNPGRKSLNRYKQNNFQQNFITTNNIN